MAFVFVYICNTFKYNPLRLHIGFVLVAAAWLSNQIWYTSPRKNHLCRGFVSADCSFVFESCLALVASCELDSRSFWRVLLSECFDFCKLVSCVYKYVYFCFGWINILAKNRCIWQCAKSITNNERTCFAYNFEKEKFESFRTNFGKSPLYIHWSF